MIGCLRQNGDWQRILNATQNWATIISATIKWVTANWASIKRAIENWATVKGGIISDCQSLGDAEQSVEIVVAFTAQLSVMIFLGTIMRKLRLKTRF